MAKLQADLKEFIELLNSRGVEYLVVGGHAVAFHGRLGLGSLGITERDLLEPKRIVQLGRPPNRIDILTSISGVAFESAWETRVQSMI